MNEPLFLTRDEALAIHADMIDRYGGSGGVRDAGLLDSALAQPQATFGGQFLCKDVAEMAAAYLFHIVKNHPFIDGNKRVGVAAAVVFLKMNGLILRPDPGGIERLALDVATGTADRGQLAEFFRARIEDVA